jgi:diguanylate cyclase (GGDEF)-like protein
MERISALLVTDDNDVVLSLEQILRTEGCTVHVAETGKEALALIKERKFQLVITELHPGGVNAAVLTKAVIETNSNALVYVMTTFTFLAEAVDVMDVGAFGYLSKPAYLKEVVYCVRRAKEWLLLRQSGHQHDQLTEMSVKDPLTGLFNRRYMQVFLKKKFEEATIRNQKFALVMVDLDHFKLYNDTNGHQAGDTLLKEAGALLIEKMRENDRAFRYGGEEFVLYCDDSDKESGRQLADRIRQLIHLYLPASASMGVAEFPADGADFESVLAGADAALYFSKENGRNRVTVADPELTKKAKHKDAPRAGDDSVA